VTSRAAVEAGVAPWLRTQKKAFSSPEFWVAGPGTAKALRALGVRRIQRPKVLGASGMPATIGSKPSRTIVHFRSDRAGPLLARQLRELGHRVSDVVVYRIGSAPGLSPQARRALLRADLVVATSPSSLSALRRALASSAFVDLRRNKPLLVLGERSRRSARGHGFRRVRVAPSATAQRFTRYLLKELRDAPT
jgi:uroporphyrinogen-III synthase